ncbi:MAG: alpha/beta fold hydrolase [Actinobacteria bacterium]|nr:alpha/beta fold hydrolase [Actinomycetota bacterium]
MTSWSTRHGSGIASYLAHRHDPHDVGGCSSARPCRGTVATWSTRIHCRARCELSPDTLDTRCVGATVFVAFSGANWSTSAARESGVVPYINRPGGVRLHAEVTGRSDAPVVLLIQGLGTDKNGWILQRFGMATRYRTIAFDNRGSGRSTTPDEPFTLEDMADDAAAVLDHFGVTSAHVVGASMGGAISQILSVKHAALVRSLTLVCTACRNKPWRTELLRHWADTANVRGMREWANDSARWLVGPRSFRRLAPALTWLGPFATHRPSKGFTAQVEAIVSTDDSMVAELSSITAPTLVIVGNQDILTPRADSEEIAERIAHAELVVISGAAHGLMFEHASTFNPIVFDFIDRAERERRAATEPASASA